MKYFVSAIFICLTALVSIKGNGQMTIEVISTPQLTPLFDDIYIAGTFNDWSENNEEFKLTQSGSTWSIQLTGANDEEIAFKFTRGDWDNVEGNAMGNYIADRTATFQNGQTLQLTIAGWEDIAGNHTVTPNVRILDSNFFMPELKRHRRIWISFPPNYFTNELYYPVVYMHDGQNLFDAATSFIGEWQVDETMASNNIEECAQAIMVGIDNGGALRMDELSPWVNAEYNEGGEGDEYLAFIVQTLKPFIDEHFRTQPEREHTAIAGSSLGGLISMYGIAKHNDVFSKAGVFSPAFWFNPEIFDYVEEHPLSSDSKVYLVCGTAEGASVVPNMQQMRDILLSSDVPQSNVGYLVVQGGQHNEAAWATQFATGFNFLYDCLTSEIQEVRSENTFSIYPNPAKDSIQLNLLSGELKRITIYDQKGKSVLQHEMKRGSLINISKLASGNYTIKVECTLPSGEAKVLTNTLVKQ